MKEKTDNNRKLEIALQIILIKPTPGVFYGLQKGSGSQYETIQKQISTANDLAFNLEIKVRDKKPDDSLPKFSGSFVQGPSSNQFVYIDIGTAAGQTDSIWSRRLKIPLTGITWKDVESLTKNAILQTRVPGTGKDGGPDCATVKPFNGWNLKL